MEQHKEHKADLEQTTPSLSKVEQESYIQKIYAQNEELVNTAIAKIKEKPLAIRTFSIESALYAGVPRIKDVKNKENYLVLLYEFAANYIEAYYPSTNIPLVAKEFALIVVERFDTFNVVDVPAFFNHMRNNPPDTYGHKIMVNELVESIQKYEDEKAILIERLNEDKAKVYMVGEVAKIGIDKEDDTLTRLIQHIEKKQKERRDRERLQEEKDRDYLALKAKKQIELQSKIDNGIITYEQAQDEYAKFKEEQK